MDGLPELGFFDRAGSKIDFGRFSLLMADEKYVTVRADIVRGCAVSTIWTGLDQGIFPGMAPPLIFETMIFAPLEPGQAPRIVYGPERYSSEAAAADGHAVALAWLADQPDSALGGKPGPASMYAGMSLLLHRSPLEPAGPPARPSRRWGRLLALMLMAAGAATAGWAVLGPGLGLGLRAWWVFVLVGLAAGCADTLSIGQD